jgi:hypothetical protein
MENDTVLDALLCGEVLWDIEAPLSERKEMMQGVLAKLEKEHQELLNTSGFFIETGVLLGALNLVAALLGGGDAERVLGSDEGENDVPD